MKEKELDEVFGIISSIRVRTGLDIEIFSSLGERLMSTDMSHEFYKFALPKKSSFKDGLYVDAQSNVTYFCVEGKASEYIGVILGANLVSQNYAYMVARLLESVLKFSEEQAQISLPEKIKKALLGELSFSQIDQFFEGASASCLYFVLYVVCPKHPDDVLALLQDLCERHDFAVKMSNDSIAVVKRSENEDDYRSVTEFAQMVLDSVSQELGIGIEIGIGGVAYGEDNISASYSEAIAAFRLGKLVDEKNKIFSYKEYIMLRLIDDIPKEKLKQNLNLLVDKNTAEIFEDVELMTTAESFLNSSLNIAETARLSFMHRNTLVYRLDKIEKMTGLNIRRFSDAVAFRMMTIVYRLCSK